MNEIDLHQSGEKQHVKQASISALEYRKKQLVAVKEITSCTEKLQNLHM